MYMRAYPRICVYMCIYGVYACKGGQEAEKREKVLDPFFKIMKSADLRNQKVYSYTLLGGGEILWNSNGCKAVHGFIGVGGSKFS